jgi:hypothetical protein
LSPGVSVLVMFGWVGLGFGINVDAQAPRSSPPAPAQVAPQVLDVFDPDADVQDMSGATSSG